MAEYTQNLNLEKPTENENFRRQVLNENIDKIDKKFGVNAAEGHIHNGLPGQGKKISYNDLLDKPDMAIPAAHKSTHASGGSDVITPTDIGAETPTGAQAKVDVVKGSLDAHLMDNSAHGISAAVKNLGNTPSIQSGLNTDRPTAGTLGRLYVSTDTKIIYQDSGTIWEPIGGDGRRFLLGNSTFNSTTGRPIAHNIGHLDYQVQITPTSDPGGYLGEYWVIKASDNIVVYCSGSTATATFDYIITY